MPKEIIFFGGFATKAEALEFGATLVGPWCVLTIIKGFFEKEKEYDDEHAFDVMTFMVVNQTTVETLQEALVVE
jgi:ribose 5-phosphate isomerase RpiB